MYIIQVHGLADDEARGIKGVTDLQFGVFGFYDREMCIAFIAEDAPPVRQPRHLYPIAFLQVVNMDAFALKSGTLNVCARGKRSKVRLPVGKTEELREQAERCSARRVCPVDVAPEALEGRWREVLVEPLPDDTGEKLKVVRRADLALHLALDIHPQGRYFRCMFVHLRQ